MQSTLNRSVAFTGVGLHSGAPVRMTVRPAPAGTGVRFCRIDVADRDQIVPARWDAVVDTRLNTRIGNAAGVTVSTIEHLMAALAGLGVDNALIDIDGPEVPIMDGSARPFVDALGAVGLSFTPAPRMAIRILRPVVVARGDARAALRPADRFEVAFGIDFEEAAIGRQRAALAVTPDSFAAELADARTFVRRPEIEALRAAGLARGGSLDNAVVVDEGAVLNPGGLRRPDEFVRHKALDAVGDLALAGGPIVGRYVGERAGHGLTNELLRALFADPRAYVREPAGTHPALGPETDPAPLPIAAE
jgi:UDP-3-O-[3-hydroxymyristoyl] N-acetylglucosamine deacetylase